MNDLVSIIIPVYNVEKYLKRCMESVLRQTYRNFEVILVDDGSTDKSLDICKEYEKKDERIKVIHKKNGGLSSARNSGLNVMKGSLFTFIDSDDWVEEKYVESLVKAILENNADIAQCSYCKKNVKDEIIMHGNIHNDILNGKDEIMRSFFVNQNYITVAWMKIYRSKKFGDVRFYEGKNNEDTIYVADYIDIVDKIVVIEDELYNYFFNENSIMNASLTDKKVSDAYFSAEYMLSKCENSYPKYSNYMRKNICDFSIGLYFQADKKLQSDLREKIYTKFDDIYNQISDKTIFGKKLLIKFFMFKRFRVILEFLWKRKLNAIR